MMAVVRAVFARLAVALVAVAACAPAPAAPAAPRPIAELATYQGSDRQQILEAGARAEKKLTWYTSLAGEIVDRMAEGFKKKYPFIDVEIFRGTESELVTRATQEAQAGQPSFDVLETQVTAIKLLYDGQLLINYSSPTVKNVPEEFKTRIGSGDVVESATDRVSIISFGYNTNLIPESAVPKTYQDLMNPALKGKLALSGTNTGQRWLGSILNILGEEKGKQWLADFSKQQQPRVQQVSGKALLDLIAKGEIPASPTIFKDHVDLAVQETKAPVKWVPLEPVVGNPGQAALAAKAPHPNAALLFIDYLFGDGAKVFQQNAYTTAADKVPFKLWIPERGKSLKDIEKDTKLWNDLFKSTFR